MNTAEMVIIYKADPTPETSVKLLRALGDEGKRLEAARKAKSPASHIAIVRQMDELWQAFCRRCPENNRFAFQNLILTIEPGLAAHLGWKPNQG